MKLDMSKAYDRVEWSFIEVALKALGFRERWIRLLMSCIRSVTYSILINGQTRRYFAPSRGLRQGDPLSPYIFLICVESLTSLINMVERRGET